MTTSAVSGLWQFLQFLDRDELHWICVTHASTPLFASNSVRTKWNRGQIIQPRTQGIRQRFRPGCTCCSDTLDTTPLFVSSWRNCPAPWAIFSSHKLTLLAQADRCPSSSLKLSLWRAVLHHWIGAGMLEFAWKLLRWRLQYPYTTSITQSRCFTQAFCLAGLRKTN